MATSYKQLGLLGCGLMGGSFALALRQAGLVRHVVGYSKSASSAARALELGVIDAVAESAMQACAGADLIVLAVPVAATGATLQAIRGCLQPGTLAMDLGSTKQDVAQAAVQQLGAALRHFVPAHPITGKEVAGVEHAEATLYQGAKVVLTPLPETDPARLQQAQALWTALGCDVRLMTPAEHDSALAAVSHLPHLVAFAYMNSLLEQGDSEALLRMAGPGFRDFTRIAAGDPALWRDVLLANRHDVQVRLAALQTAIAAFQRALDTQDAAALERLIAQASAVRSQWCG